ncbi:MAG TPA: hypothetical protein VGM54_02770 [Chthoniobacter sp.]|jgi:hypothetical protein
MSNQLLQWEHVLVMLDKCRAVIPSGQEPEIYPWPHEPEKELDQRSSIEDD